jgi:glycosyltransferase involved in cell wall biosynthesis
MITGNSVRVFKNWLYIISYVNNSLGFYWFFKELASRGIFVKVLFLHWEEPELKKKVEDLGHSCYYLRYSGKKGLWIVFWRVLRLILKLKPEVVHTHLFDASLIGLTAARLAGVKIRVHTRHHASQHHVYNPGTVKFDRLINRNSTAIIAISGNIRTLLIQKEHVNPSKIHIVYHGFDPVYFSEVSSNRIETLRKKYNLLNHSPVIGVISRYTHWKGIQFIIPAFKRLLEEYPDALLFLANARGDYAGDIKEMLVEIPASNYREVDYEADASAMYALFDVFVHVPINDHAEAFGQTYAEALLAKRTCIFTLSGIATEFVTDGINACVVPYCDSEAIYEKLKWIIAHPQLGSVMALQGDRKSHV